MFIMYLMTDALQEWIKEHVSSDLELARRDTCQVDQARATQLFHLRKRVRDGSAEEWCF